jgi:hypothetical protein
MYTSGCPKIQNRCCQRMASPPFAGSKKCIPTRRSSSSITLAAVRDGRANTTEKEVARMAHTNSGIRLNDIPGARSLKIVTMKLMAPAVVEIPRKISPSV